ncbi:brain protein I3-like [Mercenaria mercenaria]|uniref:brain protein I3-like n=1 Tax=Mercenaria mercenaria TaxID=6596 RepID=UPI001E1DFC4A|nr:brain protein I3-like [Mercenaria mercenaria]XP_053378030.1 brain protein I3-like [Mercenaria mercenaria]
MSVAQQPPPPYGYGQPVYGPPPTSNVVVVTQPGAGMTARPGTCRHCGIGYPHSTYSVMGILLAILCFPIGILCCLMLTETRCSHCRALL